MPALQAAEEEHRRLVECGVLGRGVGHGLLHGRLGSDEKAAALRAFASGKTQVLISTTVVEVGPACACAIYLLILNFQGRHLLTMGEVRPPCA